MVKNIVIGVLAFALLVSLIFHFTRPSPKPVAPVVVTVPIPEPDSIAVPEPEPEPEPEPQPEPQPDPRFLAFESAFASVAEDPGLAGAAIGFSVIDSGGEVIFEHNGDIAHIPASALKTLTTATALEVLGPEFRFETRLGVSEPDEKGISKGDLIITGGGDPMLSIADYQSWIEGLIKAGLVSVPGRVIGDGRHFKGSIYGDFWNWGDIGNGYGSPVSGLNLEHNRFTATLIPAASEGEPAGLGAILPEVPGVEWNNESLTGPAGSGDGIVIHGGERTGIMHLRGTVPLGEEMYVKGAAPDPERFAAHHLREALLAAEIVVGGAAIGASELILKKEAVPAIGKELLVHRSPPLLEIVTSIHDTSDNHETECLFQSLGLQTGMAPAEAVRSHWEARGLDLSGWRMVDGSGLARADFITPRTLARLQYLASTGPHGPAYAGSLLTAFDGALRFKAGAMSAVRSITGLLETESGEVLSFAFIVNHYGEVASVQRLQGELLGAMSAWGTELSVETSDEAAEGKTEASPVE
jgi:D-alanyl-D-alanine carboxypeptidase/D-alanyl-D-alanine-endopeptidase (penicillin-binding protein 4)